MGNNQSSSASTKPPNPQSYPPPPPHSHQHRHSNHQAQQSLSPAHSQAHQPSTATTNAPARREPKRRESIHALPWVKATAAPPSESLASATGESSIGQHRTGQQSQHSQQLSSRQRSRTINVDQNSTQLTAEAKMGNEESRLRGEESTDQRWFTPSKPVPVPMSGDEMSKQEFGTPFEPAAPPRDHNRIQPSQINRPPRLPLPIGEEDYTPGSPIISPADITAALNLDPLEAGVPRRSSILSSTTADDDEPLDDPTGYGLDPAVNKAAVPTLVEWKQKGEKVYVTGTFAGWNKKFRLQKNEGKEGFSATIPLTPGTHHLKFLVDGDFRTADHLPTAVDFSNVLVNYIEVRAEDDERKPPSKPIDIKKPRKKGRHHQQAQKPYPPPELHPPLVLPPTPPTHPIDHTQQHLTHPDDDQLLTSSDDEDDERDTTTSDSNVYRVKKWTKRIPRHLRALDAPEGSQAHRRITRAIPKMPPPPGLPGFLGKSILNGITPMKDDSSVLNLPNHTVLNHLGTSSIKDDVLATSITTRYINKYVTTIIYMPTDIRDEDELHEHDVVRDGGVHDDAPVDVVNGHGDDFAKAEKMEKRGAGEHGVKMNEDGVDSGGGGGGGGGTVEDSSSRRRSRENGVSA
ncbi:MAG: hypothetical protein M1816_002132 [Peltula sp. TS41687]|nr:MAG: hypothetical protein M1816_002132 [Peltula sp. TS41687]